MNLKQIEDILNENLAYLVDMACYSGDISKIAKAENNIKSIIPAITQLFEELREEEREVLKREVLTGFDIITQSVCAMDMFINKGYNQRNQEINDKIDKILNK